MLSRGSVDHTFGAIGSNVEEDKAAKGRAQDQRRPWNTAIVDLFEDSRCLSFDGEPIQCPRTNVEVRVGCAEYKDENRSIDHMAKSINSNL